MDNKFTMKFINHPTKEMFKIESDDIILVCQIRRWLDTFDEKEHYISEDWPQRIVWYPNNIQNRIIEELELEETA